MNSEVQKCPGLSVVKTHPAGKDPKMNQLFGNLFVCIIAGLWISLKVTQCQTFSTRIPRLNMTYCFNTRSGKTCFTIILANTSHPVRKPFEEANHLCKVHVPDSSLIVIKSLEIQRAFENFIVRQVFQNEAIIMGAKMLSANESQAWSWVNGHPYFPDVSQDARNTAGEFHYAACVESKHGHSLAYCFGNVTSRFGFICNYSTFNHRQDNKTYIANEGYVTWYDARKNCLRSGGDLASITDLQTTEEWLSLKENQKYWIGLHRNKWIWASTGAALTYTNWKGGFPDESSDKQCICFNPRCTGENGRRICEAATDRKWRTCSCNNNYAIVCQKEEKSDALPARFVFTEETQPSSTQSVKSKPSVTRTYPAIPTTPAIATTTSTKTPIATSTTASTITVTTSRFKPVISSVTTFTSTIADNTTEEIGRKTVLISHLTQKPSYNFATHQTTPFVSTSTSQSTGLFNSVRTKQILLILLLLAAVVFIVAAVIWIIRKRKYAGHNDGSPLRKTDQNEAVSPEYETMVRDKRRSDDNVPIYTDLELTQQPTPSNSTIYANVQPTAEATDMDISVVYVDPHEV